MKKKILIIATGGTIASVQTENGLVPGLTPEELLSLVPNKNDSVKVDTITICNIDSTDMTYKYWLLIAETIKKEYYNYDGFIISHGTDTMAYTAAALSYLVQNSRKPIVLTGAQKPMGSEITDAKSNLKDSITYAADDDSQGVVIVFDGQVIAGTRGKKVKTFSFSAFASINYPTIATIQDGKIIRYITPPAYSGSPFFYEKLNPKVFLLKLTPGMQPDILKLIFDQYDCIIVESFGVGGIPATLADEFCSILSNYKPEEKIVILTTQVTYEGSNASVYEVGNRIMSNFNCLEARDMTIEAVLAKIMWILSFENLDFNKIEEMFYSPIELDTIFK